MAVVQIERHPNGPRLFVGRWRIEHWHAGLSAIIGGVWAIWTDRSDFIAALRRAF